MKWLPTPIRRALEPRETDSEKIGLARAIANGWLEALPLAASITFLLLVIVECSP